MRLPLVTSSRAMLSLVFALLLAIYALGMARHVAAVAAGSDASGYMNNARLLDHKELKVKRREIEGLPLEQLPPYTYVPLGFIPKDNHEMAPTYPMGLPLLIMGFSRLVGSDLAAPTAIISNAILALVALNGISRLAGLSQPLAFMSTALLGFSGIFVWISLQAMSDGPALAWCSLAVLSAMLSRRNSSWVLLAGVAFSLSVLIRPSNMLLLLPLAVLFDRDWRLWILFAVGGVPGALFQAAVNFNLYGNVLTSGYGNIWALFGTQHFHRSVSAYVEWLPMFLTPAVVLAGGAPFIPDIRRHRTAIALMVWAAAFLGFYSFYLFTGENWTFIRFVLPCFPAIIVLMVLVMRDLTANLSPRWRWIFGIAVVIAAIGGAAAWIDDIRSLREHERQYQVAADWAIKNLPGNAVILSMQTSGALLYYTPFTIVRWEQIDPDSFPKIETACRQSERPIFAMLFPFETDEALKIRAPGRWTNIGSMDEITIWRREQI